MATDLKVPRLNLVLISGRVTRDPELRYTAKGTATLRFSIAADRSFKDDTGNFQNVTTFVDVVTWTKLAEICAENIHKGSPVIVQGRLEIRNYTDRDNVQKKSTEIIAETVQFLEFKARPDGAVEDNLHEVEPVNPPITDDDVPF
jgi:single-strand DNA-binding protein